MSKFEKDIKDDEIRIIGSNDRDKGKSKKHLLLWILAACLVIAAIIIAVVLKSGNEYAYIVDPEERTLPLKPVREAEPTHMVTKLGSEANASYPPHIELIERVINDIPLTIYIPHNAEMTLHLGPINNQDCSIIFAAQAADIRADNGKIVGAFVLKGEPKSWGLSKKGYVASINGKVTIGVAENTPLFEEATEKEGYFFRQYPLVSNGQLIDNEPKGKSIRRAICDRGGEIFMVASQTTESFHDFAQALVDLGVNQAVYLVGSAAYGWATNEKGERHEFGDENYYRSRNQQIPKNISYIVWR